jgi:hypothetical protein
MRCEQGHNVHTLYLDTTYAHEKHTIPDQNGPVNLVAEFVRAAIDGDAQLGMSRHSSTLTALRW